MPAVSCSEALNANARMAKTMKKMCKRTGIPHHRPRPILQRCTPQARILYLYGSTGRVGLPPTKRELGRLRSVDTRQLTLYPTNPVLAGK